MPDFTPETPSAWLDEADRVQAAFKAICDLSIGDGSAPRSDDCFASLKRENLTALLEILNDRLDHCLAGARTSLNNRRSIRAV